MVEDGQGLSKAAGNGEGRRGTAGDGTSDVSWGEKNLFGGV